MVTFYCNRIICSVFLNTGLGLTHSRTFFCSIALQKQRLALKLHASVRSNECAACYSSHPNSGKNLVATPSPYKPPVKPTRYGYGQKLFDGGLLPRLKDPIKTLPKYNPKDAWSEKKALFGQNDYIDILGDGSIQPYELIEGPAWLRGFRGNEHARTLRRLKFTGTKLRLTHPELYKDLRKRIFYLNKEHNIVRKSHRPKSKYI